MLGLFLLLGKVPGFAPYYVFNPIGGGALSGMVSPYLATKGFPSPRVLPVSPVSR